MRSGDMCATTHAGRPEEDALRRNFEGYVFPIRRRCAHPVAAPIPSRVNQSRGELRLDAEVAKLILSRARERVYGVST